MKRLILFLLILATACTPLDSSSGSKTGPVILATTTFLADIARNVAGDRVNIDSLLPVGADPHTYEPVPVDVAKINQSTVLIVNGLDYEQFLTPLLENAGGKRTIVTASDGLPTRQMDDENGESVTDPHMWLDVNRVIKYVENIRDGLVQADPEGTKTYKSNADTYAAKLKKLDAWIVEQVSQIPAGQRLLVTNHEALGYFADRYGFTIVGAVVPGVSSDAAPSAQQMAQLVDQIKASGAPAIFLNETDNPALATQIAQETGVKVVEDLYVESLNKSAPTYIDMMKHNVTRIVEALK